MLNFDFDMLGRLVIIMILFMIACCCAYGVMLVVERIINHIMEIQKEKNKLQKHYRTDDTDDFFFGSVNDWRNLK